MLTFDQGLQLEQPSVSYAISDFAIAEAKAFRIRTELMLALQRSIQQRGWTATQAAAALKQTLPRMQNLMNGEISRFNVEQLIQLLTLVEKDVQISVSDQHLAV